MKLLTGCLVMILMVSPLVSTGHAENDLSLYINDQEITADMYIENGRTQLDGKVVTDLLGLETKGYVPLREVFEDNNATVYFESSTNTIYVSKKEELSAEDIVVKAEEFMEKQNTYRMTGEGEMNLDFDLPEQAPEETSSEQNMTFNMKADVRHDPFSVFVVQEMDVPMHDLSDEVEGSKLFMTDEKMYQKFEEDTWIVSELDELGIDGMQHLMNLDPASSLELSKDYGVDYSLNEQVVIDEEDYYLVNISLDQDGFKKLLKDLYDMDDMLDLYEDEEVTKSMKEVFDSLDITMDYDMYVNKETFETTKIESKIDYNIEELSMSLTQTADIYDYGVELDFVDIENTITFEELHEKQMEQFEEEFEKPEETTKEKPEELQGTVAEKFNFEIIGIDAGAGIMHITSKAKDSYESLEYFDSMHASQNAMEAELQASIENEEWVVATGWTPHWKFSKWDLEFLEDPEGVYGEGEDIKAVVREELEKDMEDVHEFIDEFYMTDEELGEVMNLIDYKAMDEEKAREKWVKENDEIVKDWVPEDFDGEGKEVQLGYMNWQCSIAQAHTVKEVLQSYNYEVELIEASPALILTDMADSGIDVFVSAWETTHETYLDKFEDDIEVLGPVYEDARIGLVVPSYVDVESITELNE
ncbi:glycine betaine ABC transporter substrate-binding protein [Natranaerobius trueperi]|uniref:ABC-type glycine betaine transport system substrate-binding domain-containing protein n=1 Tax=Natranaerobius trueperi TaxID=759412 RepID=A0A226BYK0_9FIRM|nr:DUF6612 family protein [Natranaerobius trueperi]OWZ83210.1 hypothetical protein CDO51_09945 [Natranaerobius trueperi]